MSAELETDVLKGVSRSFYLSLRFLPRPMRRPASIAYLLARASDTIADSAEISAEERLDFLAKFSKQVAGEEKGEAWPQHLLNGTPDLKERILLECHADILRALSSLRAEEIGLIRELLEIIISGQRLDLERFGSADSKNIVALKSEAELDDYTWRVAGCVGIFWTKLGYETLGQKFSTAPKNELLSHAVDYGKGLQLVNILRDLPKDLVAGRSYFPLADPLDRTALMADFQKWRDRAEALVVRGSAYSGKLRSRRLRIASGLPAMIAADTLGKMRDVTFEQLEAGIKISRGSIYRLILKAWFHL